MPSPSSTRPGASHTALKARGTFSLVLRAFSYKDKEYLAQSPSATLAQKSIWVRLSPLLFPSPYSVSCSLYSFSLPKHTAHFAFSRFSILNTLSSLLNPLYSKGKHRNPFLLFHVWLHYCVTKVKHMQSTLDFKRARSFTAANPFCFEAYS